MNISSLNGSRFSKSIMQNMDTASAKKSMFSQAMNSARNASSDRLSVSTEAKQNQSLTSLTDAEINFLAGKYDPSNMTQDEQDEFLDYLQDRGIIEEADKLYLGYNGMRVVCAGMHSYTYGEDSFADDYPNSNNYLRVTKSIAAIEYDTDPEACENSEEYAKYAQRMTTLHVKVGRILEQMSKMR